MTGSEPEPTDPEDVKMIALARSALARRPDASDAGCVRDTDGRTYVGTAVALEHLRLSGLQVALAMALSSGAEGLETAVVLGDHDPTPEEGFAVSEVGARHRRFNGAAVPIWLCDADGTIRPPVDSERPAGRES